MSSDSKSFWSTIPGLITGLAGILTALVGLGTLLIQIGVIGGDGGDGDSTAKKAGSTATAAAPATQPGAAATTGMARLDVSPTAVDLSAKDKSESVTVENNGTKLLAVQQPVLSGAGKDQFDVKNGCSQLQAGDSCNVEVTFKGLLDASATMTIRASDGVTRQVTLEGTLL